MKCFLLEKTGEYSEFIQGVSSPIYKRADTGETGTADQFGPGAIIDVSDYGYLGADGKGYACVLPGGHWWYIDSRASNCGSPCKICGIKYREHCNEQGYNNQDHAYQDSNPEHRCWVRHGEAPNFHVDKNGNTCDAGAGSIMMGNYHGFLHNGSLTNC